MKYMCSECCELWQELQEVQDKYHFLVYDCLPDVMEGNYERFSKEKLQCCICFIESVKAAAERGEISLTKQQAQSLEQKLIKILRYYKIAIEAHPHNKTENH